MFLFGLWVVGRKSLLILRLGFYVSGFGSPLQVVGPLGVSS